MQKGRGAIVVTNEACDLGAYRKSDNVRIARGTQYQVLRKGSLEFISWDDTPRRGPIKTTRSCDHFRLMLDNQKIYISGSDGNQPETVYFKNQYCGGLTDKVPTIPDLSSYHMEALKFFKNGCVENEMSLAVSLIELPEIKTLLPSLKKAHSSIFRGRTGFLDHAKGLSNLNLAWSFGISPIISDVKSLISTMRDLEKHVSWLRKNQGKPVKVSFTKKLPSSSGVTVVGDNSYGKQYYVTSEEAVYHAFAIVVYNVSQLSDLELRLRTLNRAWGVSDISTILFERISYSFLLGWVSNVADLIGSIPDVITLPLKFLDIGYSYKLTQHIEEWWDSKHYYQGTCKWCIGKKNLVLFHRRPGLPVSTPSLVADADISLRQLGLAVSLLVQKI